MKRLFDLVLALALLLVLSPVLLVVAILIRLKLGSPVIFRQQRPGQYERPFFIFKFRTMTDCRDEKGNLLPDEQRLPSFGRLVRRLSIDELPQLFNVIKGDMSLVGPRPLMMQYLPRYSHEQARRHDVKPGITGWAQIHGRNALSWEEKFRLDVWYVDNGSFMLDIRILFMTVAKVLRRQDIDQVGKSVGSEEFMGSEKHM